MPKILLLRKKKYQKDKKPVIKKPKRSVSGQMFLYIENEALISLKKYCYHKKISPNKFISKLIKMWHTQNIAINPNFATEVGNLDGLELVTFVDENIRKNLIYGKYKQI